MIASLRGRLVAGVLALAAAAMLVVGGVTYAEQRSFQLSPRRPASCRPPPSPLANELGPSDGRRRRL